mgnify:CR=1 FL=1
MQIGPYYVEAELGRGGMGVVYRARHAGSGRVVALKVLAGLGDPKEQARFEGEAQAAASLRHPGIVGVLELGQQRGRTYIALELIEGETLRRRLEREGPLRPAEVARLGAELAEALAHAHQRGVLHRDVKPENVLLRADGQAVLTDFGLARRELTPGVTKTGELIGTPSFMPPELASGEGKRASPKADVYSLGATLYTLLTGRPPFAGRSVLALLAAIVQEPPPPLPSSVPAPLRVSIQACLAKDPRERPDAASLASALRKKDEGPPRGRPPTWLIGAGLVGGTLLLGAGIGLALPAPPPAPSPSLANPPLPSPEPTPSAAQQALARARAETGAQRWDAAAQAYREARAEGLPWGPWALDWARVLAREGAPSEGRALCEELAQVPELKPRADALLGELLVLSEGPEERARALLRGALPGLEGEELRRARLLLAWCASEPQHQEEARRILAVARRDAPWALAARGRLTLSGTTHEEWEEGSRCLRQACKRVPTPPAVWYVALAQLDLFLNDGEGAIADARRGLELEPESPGAVRWLVSALMIRAPSDEETIARRKRALEILDRARAQHPNDLELEYLSAQLLLGQAELEDAKRSLEALRGRATDRLRGRVLHDLAILEYKSDQPGSLEHALRLLEQAEQAVPAGKPTRATFMTQRAQLLLRDAGDAPAALEIAQEIARFPASAKLRRTQIESNLVAVEALIELGRPHVAKESLQLMWPLLSPPERYPKLRRQAERLRAQLGG